MSSLPPASPFRSSRKLVCHHSYYVVAIDYGRKGLEAIVDPEVTRREVVARLASGEYDRVAFIHHVHHGEAEDVTEELLAQAAALSEREAA